MYQETGSHLPTPPKTNLFRIRPALLLALAVVFATGPELIGAPGDFKAPQIHPVLAPLPVSVPTSMPVVSFRISVPSAASPPASAPTDTAGQTGTAVEDADVEMAADTDAESLISVSPFSNSAIEEAEESDPSAREFPQVAIAVPQLQDLESNENSAEWQHDSADDDIPMVNILGQDLPAGILHQLTWAASQSFSGIEIPTPILVAHGANPGPTLCLVAAIHGDELNSIETVRRVIYQLNLEKLNGIVIGVPIMNMQAFQHHSRYLDDRRDLNRYFPGNPNGSSAARIAYSFFTEVVRHCDGLVDLHTGSFYRTNLPQLRADLNNPRIVELTKGFGSTVILHSTGAQGTLRRAAADAGIPSVTLEAGEPLRVNLDAVEHSEKAILTLLDTLAMYSKHSMWGNPEPVYYQSRWVRANQGGILFSQVKLGRKVNLDDLLGTVTDPITNRQTEIRSPFNGRLIGMAVNQFVMPGFATFHIGLVAPVGEAVVESNAQPADEEADPHD